MGMKAIDAINQLDNNGDLSKEEKRELNNLDRNDYVQAKDQLGDTTITIGKDSVSLKDAVTYNPETLANTQAVNASDRAKLQAYLIANGQDLHGLTWKLGIDGIIGANSKQAIKNTKSLIESQNPTETGNTNKQETKEETIETDNSLLFSSANELLKANLIKYLGDDGVTNWETDYDLLQQNQDELGNSTYTLKSCRFNQNTKTFTINYKSSETNQNESITIKADEIISKNQDKQNRYDIRKFGDIIAEEINKKENKLHGDNVIKRNHEAMEELNTTVEKNKKAVNNLINTFDYNSIQDPLIKQYFIGNQKGRKILTCTDCSYSGGLTLENKRAQTKYKIELNELQTNGQFDASKFELQLNQLCQEDAIQFFHESFARRIDNLQGIGDLTTQSQINLTEKTLTKLQNDFDKIAKKGNEYRDKTFIQQKMKIKFLQLRFKKQKNYVDAKDKFNNTLVDIKNCFEWTDVLDGSKVKADNVTKLLNTLGITTEQRDQNHPTDLTIINNNDIYKAFAGANRTNEYTSKINEIKAAIQNDPAKADITIKTIDA